MAPGRSPAVSGRRRRRGLRWSAARKQRPQLPRSPSSPEPPPAGAGDPAVLPPGTHVEVRIDSDGFYGTWYRATIVDFAPVRGRGYPARYTVNYADLLAADGVGLLAEPFSPTHVRPRPPPPPPESPPQFLPDDAVEAFHNSGWWSGIVVSADPASVTVAFPISREVIPFPPHLVRPRRDNVGGGVWAPSRRVIAVRPKAPVRVYEAGEDVEVGVDRELYGYSWVPATVAKVIDDLSYVVEYSDVEEGGGGGAEKTTEYLHWQFIRPAVERLPQDSDFRLEPGAAVEAYCEGAWSAGVVRGVLGGDEFEVSINGNKASQLVTKAEFLKPHYKWEDGKQWRSLNAKRQADFRRSSGSGKRSRLNKVTFSDEEQTHDYSGAKKSMIELQQNETLLAENDGQASVSKTGTALEISRPSIHHQNSCSPLDGHSTAPKFHACDNLQNQLGRNNKLRKVYTSKKVSKEREWLEQPHSLHSSLESPCTGQKIGVNEIQLESAESTQMLLERTVEDTMDANELTYQEPVAMIPLSLESAYNDIDTHGNQPDEVLTAPSSGCQENRDADALRHSTGNQVPFDKMPELWSILEEKDVFKEFPQQPHVLPLQQCLPELREGKALYLMTSFYHIVENTRKSSITDHEESFEGKKRALVELKDHGFDVQHIESLLDDMIKVKFEHSKHLEEKITVEAQKQCTLNSLSRKDLLLCENDAAMAELEQKVQHLRQKVENLSQKVEHLRQEGQMIEQDKVDEEEKLSEQNVVESRVNKALDADEQQFHAILARSRQKPLI